MRVLPWFAMTLALSAPLTALATPDDMEQQALHAIKALGGALQQEMKSAMQQGGPQSAVAACNAQALPLTAKISEAQGLEIGRTALRLRNPDNRPDAWELAVLKQFQQRQADGEPLKGMRYSEVVEQDGQRVYRLMQAIETQPGCLKCHGSELDAKLGEVIDQLYPEDQAKGFSAGEMRGAFSVRKVL